MNAIRQGLSGAISEAVYCRHTVEMKTITLHSHVKNILIYVESATGAMKMLLEVIMSSTGI